MVAKKNHQSVLKKLKKQVSILQRKEERSRNKLTVTLKKIKKLGISYKTKLTKKIRAIKGKASKIKGATYAKVAANIQRKLIKGFESKSKAIASAIAKIEKKHTSKFTKGVAKKAKKVKKSKVVKKVISAGKVALRKTKSKLATKAKKTRRGRRRSKSK